MKKIGLLLSAILFSALLNGKFAFAETVKEKLESITNIKEAFKLRDPFRVPRLKRSVVTKPGIAGDSKKKDWSTVAISDIKIVGILVGKNKRAMVQIGEGSDNFFILKENMVIGPDKAVLKAILPGGIVLVEKFVNIYGQEEYLETIIPVSTSSQVNTVAEGERPPSKP